MKTTFTTKAAAALALMMVSSASMAAIQLTKHNLGLSRTTNGGLFNASPNFTTATTEICIFCHTPHGADTKAQAPLWNRTLSTATYQTYSSLGTSTLDSKEAPIGSVSLACLSCHDGTQAMNVVINSQGSGTVGSVGVGTAAGAGGPNPGSFGEFTAMSEVAGEMIYLATDLRNDHPISIQYAGASSFNTTGNDADFTAATSAGAINGQTVWYVEAATPVSYTNADGSVTSGTAGALDKTDLKLYSRNGTGDWGTGLGAVQPFVECASCHDPHVEATTFLRMGNNNGSKVCLTCHTK